MRATVVPGPRREDALLDRIAPPPLTQVLSRQPARHPHGTRMVSPEPARHGADAVIGKQRRPFFTPGPPGRRHTPLSRRDRPALAGTGLVPSLLAALQLQVPPADHLAQLLRASLPHAGAWSFPFALQHRRLALVDGAGEDPRGSI